jgi:hypothetical protein
MFRRFFVGAALLLTLATAANGQDWARNMFKVTDHDFGMVAKDAKAEFRFVFNNIYMEDVHIASAHSSCGCTSVRIENPTVKTYESGAIVAHFNTDSFLGQRGATITVTIDQPFYAEVQLQVRGYIRGDVTVEPGSVQIGSIDQGAAAEQTVTVNCFGRRNWQILEVKSNNPHVTAKAVETGRNYNQVSYSLQVQVDKDAPAGYINEHLMLVTNDSQATQIPVLVEGRVMPGIMLSPAALFMGVVEPGQKITKQLVVKGKKPFRVLEVTCDDKSFSFDTSSAGEPKPVHLIPVTFTAGTDAGKVVKTIRVRTDQGEMTPELSAYAVVANTR